MEKLSISELLLNLKNAGIAVTDHMAERFQEEQIDGMTFIELNDEELKAIGFLSIGSRKSVQRLFNKYKKEFPKATSDDNSVMIFPLFHDLKQKVLESENGPQIVEQLERDRFFNSSNHNKFIRLVVEIMRERVAKENINPDYPPKAIKSAMASAIVESFPLLRYDCEPGTCGYEAYYNQHNGKGSIENRLKTIRKGLEPSKKKYKMEVKRKLDESITSSSSSSLVCHADSQSTADTVDIREHEDMKPSIEKIEQLRQLKPDTINKITIYKMMEETFFYRRQEIDADFPSISVILDHYPRFLDIDEGALIEEEFKRLKPKARRLENILFPNKIIKVAQIKKQFRRISTDDYLAAILALIELIPPRNVKLQHAVILFRGNGMDTASFAKTKEAGLTQPFLLALGNKSNPEGYFLIADHFSIPLGNNLIRAFQILYYSFWVFNVSYYPALSVFFNFFDHLILDMEAKSSVKNLLTAMNNAII